MSTRCLLLSAVWAASLLGAGTAAAQGIYVPHPFPDDTAPRPTYRERLQQFPPPGGRLGGGPLEYVLTGGRPVPVAPEYAQTVLPNIVDQPYARPGDRRADYGGVAAGPPRTGGYPAADDAVYVAPVPRRTALPRGGLPPFHDDGAPTFYAPSSETSPAYAYTALAPQRAAEGGEERALFDFSQPAIGSGASPAAPPATQPGWPEGASDPLGLGALFGGQSEGGVALAAAPAVGPGLNPIYQRQIVSYAGRERPGTIVIDTPDKFLYLVQEGGSAIRYGIGVGRPGFTWAGVKTVSRKAEWPGWTPPSQMLKRRPDLPRHMAGGEANPLGARALYLGSSMYRIHGTSEPDTIGTNVSSGCIRMTNADVTDLYGRVPVGTRVVVR